MDQEQALPKPTRDLETAKTDLSMFGYCLIEQAVCPDRLEALRQRLEEQALAEQQAGIGYFDGAPDQNWGSFRGADGQLRSDGFTKAAGGINQRVWMLINKGQVFVDLLNHDLTRGLVAHVLGDHYLLSSYTANIANPGGVAMKLHTDQWWAPAPTRRERRALAIGSMTRQRFDKDDVEGEPSMIAPAACCNIMWMLDDFTEENGATRIVPASHVFGRQPDHERDKDVVSVPATGPAGNAMVFDGRLWHGTGANISKDQRRGLLTTFCGPQFRPQENFTVGARQEVLAQASEDLLELLGFGVWCGYGRTGNPTVAFIDPEENPPGAMQPK
ncbi:MAG: phytanoyl-CoA dioxygenase family protein [Geminicoccaceae bacterium]